MAKKKTSSIKIKPISQAAVPKQTPAPGTADNRPEVPATAPPVPPEVSKQYDLHREPLHAPAAAASPAPDQAQPANADPAIDNPETNAAVDDIVSQESDQLLQLADGETGGHPPKPHGFWHKLADFFKAWWRNKTARYTTLAIIAAGLVVAGTVPDVRYALLNTAGVRSSASVVVLDGTTRLPLKNVTVSLNGVTTQTDRTGVAAIRHLKLGDYRLRVKRVAFAPHSQAVTIGWGSNPLGNVNLRSVGVRYQIIVKDYLSGKPVRGAEIESDQLNALSDDNGKATLTMADTAATTLTASLNASGYRPETMELNASREAPVTVALVSAQRAVYISKASGTYDVYSVYADGKDRKILLTGSGLESSRLGLAVSPDGSQAALVSTRDDLRDTDGYLLQALTFINTESGAHTTVDHAQSIQLVDWSGDRLTYRAAIASASAANPQRNRLIAYNFASNARMQLASANQFNTLMAIDGFVYYAPSSTDTKAALGLFRIKPDNTSRERLVNQEVWAGLRTSLHNLSLQTPGGWLTYDIATKKAQPAAAPENFVQTQFTNRGNLTAWTDVRDAKGSLQLSDGSRSRTLVSQPGLTFPVYWLTDKALVYRVATATETADYAVSADGGNPRKLSDVTAASGLTQGY